MAQLFTRYFIISTLIAHFLISSHTSLGYFIYLPKLCTCDHTQEIHLHPRNQEDRFFSPVQSFLTLKLSSENSNLNDEICQTNRTQNDEEMDPHLCPHEKSKRVLETQLLLSYSLFISTEQAQYYTPLLSFLGNIHSDAMLPTFEYLTDIDRPPRTLS